MHFSWLKTDRVVHVTSEKVWKDLMEAGNGKKNVFFVHLPVLGTPRRILLFCVSIVIRMV